MQTSLELNRQLTAAILLLLLLLLVGMRATHLDSPLYGRNQLRATETAAIARNFHEGAMNPFYPQVDWGGAGPGYVKDSFPLHSYIVASLYRMFGPGEVLGRLVAVLSSLLSGVLVYLMGRRLYGPLAGLFGLFLFAVSPLGAFYGGNFHPAALNTLCSVAGVYLFWSWLLSKRELTYVASVLMLAAGLLIKPMNVFVGLPIAYLCFREYGWRAVWQWRILLCAVVAVLPATFWYVHAEGLWNEYGNANVSPWNYPWHEYSISQLTSLDFYKVMLERFALEILTPSGTLLLVLGALARPRDGAYVPQVWLLGFAIIATIFAGSFRPHDYYQMPIIPIAAVLVGAGAAALWRQPTEGSVFRGTLASRALVVVLCAMTLSSSLRAAHDEFAVPKDIPELEFAARVNELTEPGALVIYGSRDRRGTPVASQECCRHREPTGEYYGHEGVLLYQSHRKGWSIQLEDYRLAVIESLRERGAEYFVTDKFSALEHKQAFIERMAQEYEVLDDDERWIIVALKKPAGASSSSPGAAGS